MRSMIVVAVALLGLAACSDDTPKAADPQAGSSAGPSAGTIPDATGSGAPTAPQGGTGTATDKAACAAIETKLSEWGRAFGTAIGGLGAAGSDTAKVTEVVNQAKAANTRFADALRAEAGKTKDAHVKKVATDLGATLDKLNTQLDPQQIAKDPGALTAAFDSPGYAAATDAYEKVCSG